MRTDSKHQRALQVPISSCRERELLCEQQQRKATVQGFLSGLLLVVAAIFASTGLAEAQPIQVSTQVLPPYSPYLSDYVGFNNKILITLTNTSGQAQSVRLAGSIKGNTGVIIVMPNTYIPPAPIAVPANGVKVLNGAQLKDYFDPDNLQFSGISKQEVVQGNGLPEGDYALCIQALDYGNGNPLSNPAPSGCANFQITHYNPPGLLTPSCNSNVDPSNPQSLLFTWSIPPGAPPANIEYVLKIVEVIPNNIPAAQAMAAAPDPPFFEKVVATTSYLYGAIDPALEEGTTYAVRVTARTKQGFSPLSFKNNGHSVVCSFVYGSEEDLVEEDEQGNIDLEEDYVSDCESLNCAPSAPAANVSNYVYKVGDEVKIGYFNLKLTSLSDPNAANLTGEGTIDAPIFKMQLKTTFTGLKVNPDHKVYQGKALGAYDPGAQVDQALQNFGNNLENITAQKVKSVADFVKSNQKYIENFVNVETKGLPFAWKDMVDSKLQLIDVVAIEFAPDGARLNAVMEFPIPEANNEILAFAQKNVCFHPTGLSIDGLQKLTMLGNDKTMDWGPNISLTLKKANGDNGTFVKWDCEGFKGLQVDGFFTFSNQLIEKPEGNGDVKANFKLNAGAWGDILGEVSMDPFVVKGMKGVKFEFNQVILDFSDTRNAQDMVFPANFNGGKGNDWRGFYFDELKVTLPNYLKKNNAPIEITLGDAFINRLGFTGTIKVEPVFTIDQGGIGGWGFSMDKFEMAFLNNSLTKGQFNGKIKLPVAQTGIAYSCLLSNSNQGVQTAFSVSNIGDIEVDMWAATLSLYNGSTLSIETIGNDVTVEAVLSGDLTIDKKFPSMKNVSVKIPNVEFQDFTIRNKKPYLSATYFKFASPEKNFAGFPVSIKPDDGIELKFQDNGQKAGLKLGFQIGLDGNGESAISGGTSFTVWGKMQEQNGKQTWGLDKPELNAIWVDAKVASCEIKGEINLYNGDEKFGDGFRGALSVKFKPLIDLSATVQFGSTNYKNGNTRYRYWYVDGMAVMQAGIMVYPGFGIYGFGGGAYYHMKPVGGALGAASLEGDPNNAKDFDQDKAGASSSGKTYDPDPNIAFGFKATIVMGTMPSPKAFNGDITLEASFFQGGGLNEISLIGNGYFVSDLDPKQRPSESKAIVSASVGFKYSAAQKTFDGLIEINFNLKAGQKNLLVGGGQCAMHFSKDKWFIKVGTPDDPIGLTVLDLLAIDTYFMVGKNSLPPLPPLPTSPINFQEKLPYFNQQNPRDAGVNDGSGFALGQQLSINTGKMKFLIFYARIAIAFGYDVSVLKENLECADAKGGIAGMNGWYARGQVYAGLEAEIGLDINLWFIKADISLLEVGVYAGLKAGLPNPTWLKGQVAGYYSVLNGLLTGHCTFKFHYGTECSPGGNDPFGGLKVIADIKPSGNDVDVFSYPEVAFNLPVGQNKVISVQGVNEEEEVVTSRFRFGVREFSVTQIKKGNQSVNKKVNGTYSIYNNSMAALFEPNAMLDELSRFRVRVKIYGDRLVDGEWIRITKNKYTNAEHVEIREQFFNTGKAPERFVDNNIVMTSPGQRQRYYYTSDGGSEGFVRFKLFPSNIPNLKPEDQDYEYKYVARFQEIGAGSKRVGETPVTWDASPSAPKAKFGIPQNVLKSKQLYIIQIVRKKVKKGGAMGVGGMKLGFSSGKGDGKKIGGFQVKGGEKGSGGKGGGGDDSNLESYTQSQSIGGGQSIKVKQQRLKAIQLGDNEFMVYQIAFKTSQYTRLKNKMLDYIKSANQTSIKTGNGSDSNTIYARYKGKEALGWYDLKQMAWTKGGKTEYIDPLIRLEVVDMSNLGSDSYWSTLDAYYLDHIEDPYLNDKLRWAYSNQNVSEVNQQAVRTYPSKNAYLPGSRLTNGTNIGEMTFPKWAAGIRYVGNGWSTKLSDAEINAVYWKDFQPEPDKPKIMLKAQAVKGATQIKAKGNGAPKGGGGMANANMGFANNENNTLEIRYDAATVLLKDRDAAAQALLSRYGLNASYFNKYQPWLQFAAKNYKTLIQSGTKNSNYYEMKVSRTSEYRLIMKDRDGNTLLHNGGQIDLDLP